MRVQTKITNLGRTQFTFSGPKGKRMEIKGGQTVTYPYDLFSVLNKNDIKALEKSAAKGALKVETEIITDQNVLRVSSAGDVNIALAGEVAKETSEAAKNPIPKGFSNHAKEKPNMSASGVVVTKGSKAMEAMGASETSNMDGKIKDIVIKNGKAEEVGGHGADVGIVQPASQIAVEAHNVFNKQASEKSDIDLINEWLQNKDYKAVFDWLTENYPDEFADTTKAAVRKCKSFEDLRTLLNI